MKTFLRVAEVIWQTIGILYIPVYFTFFVLRWIARFMLAIAHYGMLEKRMANDIMKSLFCL